MMSNRTSHPTAWFGFGMFATWAASFSLAEMMGDQSRGRWSGESGLYIGHVAAALAAGMMSAIFGGWLWLRRRSVGPIRLHFGVPLALGLLDPVITVASLMVMYRCVPFRLFGWAGPIVTFGMPVAMAEITLRSMRWMSQKRPAKSAGDVFGDV